MALREVSMPDTFEPPEESEDKAIALRPSLPLAEVNLTPMPVSAILQQVQQIQELMAAVMKSGVHYDKLPGTDKPTLLKPGAEKLGFTFHLKPHYTWKEGDLPGDHKEYEFKCRLEHVPTGRIVGEGVGYCSTMETRYRFRNAERTCPECGVAAIIKGKEQFGGGWLCWKAKDGCGAKFSDDAPEIMDQEVGKVENPNIADTYNPAFKIGKKRAHVDAIITTLAASDVFNQDLDDMEEDKQAARGGKTQKQSSATPEDLQETVFQVEPNKEYQCKIKHLRWDTSGKKSFGILDVGVPFNEGTPQAGDHVLPSLYFYRKPEHLALFATDVWPKLSTWPCKLSIKMTERGNKTWYYLNAFELDPDNVVIQAYTDSKMAIENAAATQEFALGDTAPGNRSAGDVLRFFISNHEDFLQFDSNEMPVPSHFATLTKKQQDTLAEAIESGFIFEFYKEMMQKPPAEEEV